MFIGKHISICSMWVIHLTYVMVAVVPLDQMQWDVT